MPENSVRVDYAKAMLESAYDIDSWGLGVQKHLVKSLVHDPAQVGKSRYLSRALHAGAASGLIACATAYGFDVYGKNYDANVQNSLRDLKYAQNSLDGFVFRTLANDVNYAQTRGNLGLNNLHETMGIFESLYRKGYFSRPPSRHAVEKYLRYGIMEFSATLGRESVMVDFKRLDRDKEAVMLGDARKECVSFHSNKLGVMAWVAELANSVLPEELGAFGYKAWIKSITQDAKLSASWKELFNEDVPAPDALVSSSRKLVVEAKKFVNPNGYYGSGP